MTTGKNAMLGIGNKSRTSGSAAVRIPIHQPMARPSAVPGINAIRKEVISRPRVVPAWSHNSPPTARPMNVLTIFVGGGKKAARKKPAWTKTSQAASAVRDVASGMINSREKSRRVREGITLCTPDACNVSIVLIDLNNLNTLNRFNKRRSLAHRFTHGPSPFLLLLED